MFGTKTTLRALTATGWIWVGARPMEAVRGWVQRIALAAGLRVEAAPESPASRVDG